MLTFGPSSLNDTWAKKNTSPQQEGILRILHAFCLLQFFVRPRAETWLSQTRIWPPHRALGAHVKMLSPHGNKAEFVIYYLEYSPFYNNTSHLVVYLCSSLWNTGLERLYLILLHRFICFLYQCPCVATGNNIIYLYNTINFLFHGQIVFIPISFSLPLTFFRICE